MSKVLITTFFLIVALTAAAHAELKFRRGDSFLVKGLAYNVEVYCSSPYERYRWMGTEYCEDITVTPSDRGYDRLAGTSNPEMERVEIRRGKMSYTEKYDGKGGVSESFPLLRVLRDGLQTFAYKLLGKNGPKGRPVLEQGTFDVRASFDVTQYPPQTYHYRVGYNQRCTFRPSHDYICSSRRR
jgi:hypothetical protein